MGRIIFGALLAMAITISSVGCGDIACVDGPLVVFSVRVEDQEGNPVEGLRIRVTHLKSGEELVVSGFSDLEDYGRYPILDSSHVSSGPVRNRDEIEVHGENKEVEFTERYVVRVDSFLGRCPELSELEGNTTVVLGM